MMVSFGWIVTAFFAMMMDKEKIHQISSVGGKIMYQFLHRNAKHL